MKLKKTLKILGLMLSLTLPASFIGCGNSTINTAKTSTNLSNYELESYKQQMGKLESLNKFVNGEKIIIGFSLDSLKEPIWKQSRDAFIKKANELGANVIVEQANGDDGLQSSQVDKLIAEGVNVLVIAPHDGELSATAVEKAHNAGIKVISFDRLVKNSNLDFYVAVDNAKVGELQAKEILKNVKSGNIAYVGGSPTDNNALLFREGALKVLTENKDINIVMDKYSTDWKADVAKDNVIDLLTASTNIQGIVCANDGTASGAIAALEKFSLAGKVPVTGLDSELTACQRIVEGKQLMTIYKPINEMADKAAEFAVKMAKGESIQPNNKMYNGKNDVPSYFADPIVVTKENMMDTIIKDNFHSFEDIYKNVPENERPKQ